MSLYSFFKRKSEEDPANVIQDKSTGNIRLNVQEQFALPFVCDQNFVTLFESVPEVFFPIDFIASRASGAKFVLKKTKDDSIVWNNDSVNRILSRPNCLFTWKEFVYAHFAYKLCTGNSFIRAAVPGMFSGNKNLWKWCSNYWVLPADKVVINPQRSNIPLFGIAVKEDIIESYNLQCGFGLPLKFMPEQIMHDREVNLQFGAGPGFMRGVSRLKSQLKPISNLIAVYEARNVIYVKRGGLGWLVSAKADDTGTIALTEDDKKKIREEHYKTYGLGENQFPYGISDVPLNFIRTNLSISELQPFEETLADAISIAGAFNIPAVLVPRKDQSTFSNQKTAEKSVYSSFVIPLTQQFCKDMTDFLGLENDGFYLDCDFSDVDCLQEGRKESEEVKSSISTRCREEFLSGIIRLNDWRAQIGESKVDIPLYDKLIFEMSPDEIVKVKLILNLTQRKDEGNIQKPALQNESK